jgi:hypothetical protein
MKGPAMKKLMIPAIASLATVCLSVNLVVLSLGGWSWAAMGARQAALTGGKSARHWRHEKERLMSDARFVVSAVRYLLEPVPPVFVHRTASN